ncbi:MAG: Asp-tRNA(Asn)/Glu-tRNA(Gln) amidotransferase subunit GatC [Ekhidna sp.]
MEITDEIIKKTAYLARIEIQERELELLKSDLQKMINWVDKLQEVDTEGVEPLTHMTTEINRFREDTSANTISREQGLKNAPKHDATYFRVPKVIK